MLAVENGSLFDVPDSEFEKCVACGIRTCVRKSTRIEIRQHYLHGAGQLCCECGKTNDELVRARATIKA